MTEKKNYQYNSVLAPYIEKYIIERRMSGCIFNGSAYQLKRFDEYWISNGYKDIHITAKRIEKWLCRLSDSESKSSQSGRVCALRQFCRYIKSLGIECHVPMISVGEDHNSVHILSKSEIKELFNIVDNYHPAFNCSAFNRLADEYPIIFRLYYCCGMRNNEVCSLETADVDFDNGIITIRDGKNQKDRLVYLSYDMNKLLNKYFAKIKKTIGFIPRWLFPGLNVDNHISKSSIDRKFQAFWNMTECSRKCDKKPTPHCLRHTFVVDRINLWVMDDIDINTMMPYLSKYLGHKSPDETFYYYHLVDDAFKIVNMKDTLANKVIPEVRRR